MPIRFLYCKLGFLSSLINTVMFWKLYTSDFQKIDSQYKNIKVTFIRNNVSITDKVILELGPGNSYINAYNFILQGVKKVILVDKFPRILESKKQKEFSAHEIDFIKTKYKQKSLSFLDKNNKIDPLYIEFRNTDLRDIQNLEVDIIISTSVLEHVKNVGEYIKKMYSILNYGGYMYHAIDMRDHYNFEKPFLFYKYSNKTWNKFLTKEGLSFTNRWRYDDFIDFFKKIGFSIIEERKTNYDLSGVRIHPQFRKKKNLNTGIMHILLRKE